MRPRLVRVRSGEARRRRQRDRLGAGQGDRQRIAVGCRDGIAAARCRIGEPIAAEALTVIGGERIGLNGAGARRGAVTSGVDRRVARRCFRQKCKLPSVQPTRAMLMTPKIIARNTVPTNANSMTVAPRSQLRRWRNLVTLIHPLHCCGGHGLGRGEAQTGEGRRIGIIDLDHNVVSGGSCRIGRRRSRTVVRARRRGAGRLQRGARSAVEDLTRVAADHSDTGTERGALSRSQW